MAVNDLELFPVVDENGTVIGRATRRECHSGSRLLHPVVHLHVINEHGEMYLQKRSMDKDIQPGKWDTAVGGHIDYGEEVVAALFREAREELGLTSFEPVRLPAYKYSSDKECELINPFFVYVSDSCMIQPDPAEISEGRFWSLSEIEGCIGKEVFTPNFEQEFLMIKDFIK